MSNKMWGGRFSSSPDAIMEAINASIDVDRRLYAHDIAASKAHAAMLASRGIIGEDNAGKIAKGLDTILSEIADGKFTFSKALEDVHMNMSSRLAELIEQGRLHTARSRNDRWRPIQALDARYHRRTRRKLARLSARARGQGARTCRDRDARAHAFADGSAGDIRASSTCLCRDGGARPRPLRRCARKRLNECPLEHCRARRKPPLRSTAT